MTRTTAFALAACLLAAPALAQTVVPAQSEISFVSRQMGVPIEGRFKTFSAQLSLDPRRPEAGKVALTIAMASASFAASEAETEVAKPAWFDVARFPQAQFQSTVIKAAGAGRFEVSGKLTIKGATQELTVPVTLAQSGSAGTASGSFTIKRLDFRIGDGEWSDTSMVANEVQVRFRFALTALAAP
jgi:polyisoprenoid-binding protein YceI